MRRAVVLVALVAFAFGCAYLAGALHYGRGTLAQPGPGIFPLCIAALVLIGAVGTALQAMRGEDDAAPEWPVGVAAIRVLGLAVTVTGYTVLLPFLGHLLAGGLLTLIALRIMGLRPFWWSLTLAILLTGVSYYLFTILLSVPLPTGSWFEG